MAACVRVTECRLCDSRDLDLIVSFTPTPPGDAYVTAAQLTTPQPCYPLDVVSCRACGAEQLADTVDPALIYTQYTYTTSISVGLDAHFARYAAEVIDRVQPPAGALIVDIGSNDGTLLKAFKAQGYSVFGFDPANDIAEGASERGIPTKCAYFGDATADDFLETTGLSAQIITANHVMANVADLHDFLDGVKTLLAPDGTFVFETGYWPAIMRNRLIDTIEHEHIHYFAVEPLRQVFARHGLRLVSVSQQPTKGGSLRGYVTHVGHQRADDSVETLVRDEATLTSLHAWARDLDVLRATIGHMIGHKSPSARWVGYGASVGSTLQLHHFGLGHVLSELWDDNTCRHGLYSPGFHLPVVAPNASQADLVVILAWRYADLIRQHQPQYVGRCVIPLPEVQFV